MLKILFVGLGGFLGAITRYLSILGINRISNSHWFPFGTLFVNVLGSFTIGLLGGLAQSKDLFSEHIRLFIFIGILGGFTTFSSFSYDTLTLANNSHSIGAILNVFIQIVLCLSFAWLGYALSN